MMNVRYDAPAGTPMKFPDAGEAARPVRAYGCVRCQQEHRQGIDAEYEPHLHHQSKHGWYDRSPSSKDVLERLMQGK